MTDDTKTALKIFGILGGYAVLCSLTPWAIPLGIIGYFALITYNDGYR